MSHQTFTRLVQILFGATLAALTGCFPQFQTLHQTAAKPTIPLGAPAYSDVCFSSRWPRPRNPLDTFETFTAAKKFHATYLNWVYVTDPNFIRKADSLGLKVQVALTPTLPDLPFGSGKNEVGRIVDSLGNKVTAPWMKGWGNWWGCANHPDFQETYFAYIQSALAAGAFAFQVDDPAMGYLLLRNKWEKICYCPHCQVIADSLGVSVNEIQEASVARFHRKMRDSATGLAGRPVPFSCNNFEGDWELFPYRLFDFGIAEIPERRANPEYVYATIREARRLGKAQVFTFVSDRDWLIGKMIAAAYASGGNMLVPWDVWQGSGKDRYFGKPETFAPLYGFVRANAKWLDGYEDAFYANSQDEPRFADPEDWPISFSAYRRQFYAFARAKPGEPDAPIVVHLIDWHVLMEPFTLSLNEKRFFQQGIGTVELLTPVQFDPAMHEATAVGGFSNLSKTQTLDFQQKGRTVTLQIPKLDQHWGILVVRPKVSE